MIISLEDLINQYKWLNVDDSTIIKQWFILNSQYEEGIKMLAELAEEKIKEDTTLISHLQTWGSSTYPNLYKEYPLDIADFLNKISNEYICYGYISKNYIAKAKELLPTINQPSCYFQDTIAYLENVYGIFFKDRIGNKPRETFNNQAYTILQKRKELKEEIKRLNGRI